MDIVLIVGASFMIVVIGLLSVGWAVGKTQSMPDQIVIDAQEAIEFCAEALADEVTAVMSYDDLRRLLRLHLEWIQAYHWAPESPNMAPIVFEEFDPISYIQERADTVGLVVDPGHIKAVVDAHSAYLRVVGALHIDDPVAVEADLANTPLLAGPDNGSQLEAGPDT